MDLADQVEDFICSFEAIGDLEMDSLIMFVFIWALSVLVLLWLGKFLYQKYQNQKLAAQTGGTTSTTSATGTIPSSPTTPSVTTAKLTSSPLSAASPGRSLGAPAPSRGRGVQQDLATTSKIKSTSQTALLQNQSALRKRFTRKSPGPDVQRRPRNIPAPSNVVGPDETTVTWTSQVFKWLYSDLVIVNDLLYGWIQAINAGLKVSSEDNGILVEIVRVLPESTPPVISNIYADKSPQNVNLVVITFDIETTIVLQIKAYRQLSGKQETLHYRATVNRFRGHLSITINYTSLVGEMKIEGYPDIKINIATIGPVKATGKEEGQIQDMIVEALNISLRETMYPVDFSVHSTCPRALKMEPDDSSYSFDFPNPYDYMESSRDHQYDQSQPSMYSRSHVDNNQMSMPMTASRRLLVKIVKGDGLAHARDPYCVVEMDEPPQKNQTGARQGGNPYWDEHFLFDLSSQSSEILFEVYDRPVNPNDMPKFLGLGLVGIDELAVGPSSSQMITLQPRPYETEEVFGVITIEFVFIEGAQIPMTSGRRPYKLKEALKIDASQNPTQELMVDQQLKPGLLSPNNRALTPQRQDQFQQHHQQELLRNQYNRNMNPNSLPTSSTSNDINNISQINNSITTNSNVNAKYSSYNTPSMTTSTPKKPNETYNTTTTSTLSSSPRTSTAMTTTSLSPTTSHVPQRATLASTNGISTDVADRGRERKRTTIFGTLRKRLTRSKPRNGSAERDAGGAVPTNGFADSRSISADRLHAQQQQQQHQQQQQQHYQYQQSLQPHGLKPLPLQSQQQQTHKYSTLTSPTGHLPNLSRRSSLSETSGISGLSSASTKTFLHEASSLVLEVIENGVKRHYLVPMSIAQKPRWRRKGTKLHIYNDHTFVAKHLSSGMICEICHRTFPRRPGKQGYECRDCLLKCHKQCHVRTPQLCSKPTILSIELCKIKYDSDDTAIRML